MMFVHGFSIVEVICFEKEFCVEKRALLRRGTSYNTRPLREPRPTRVGSNCASARFSVRCRARLFAQQRPRVSGWDRVVWEMPCTVLRQGTGKPAKGSGQVLAQVGLMGFRAKKALGGYGFDCECVGWYVSRKVSAWSGRPEGGLS